MLRTHITAEDTVYEKHERRTQGHGAPCTGFVCFHNYVGWYFASYRPLGDNPARPVSCFLWTVC